MTDDRFEEFLREAAREYRPPPRTPRAEMWERIEMARRDRRAGWWRRREPIVVGLRWGIGVAALLAIGIGIGAGVFGGRGPTAGAPAVGTNTDAIDDAVVFRFAAADHLKQTDAFLSLFRTEARSGRADREVTQWGRELLATTRLMLDSPAGEDEVLRRLLEDLELVLVQIARYASRDDAAELELIEDGIDQGGVQLRLQAALTMDGNTIPILGEI